MAALQTAQQILSLARSKQGSDRERLVLSLADLCEAGADEDGGLSPPMAQLADQVFRDLIHHAAVDIRRALAERLASASWAPRELIQSLACDEIDVARPVIAQSPILTDEDLLDLLGRAALEHQIEVARRPRIGAAIVDLILMQGHPSVLTALADNGTAELSDAGMRQLVDASKEIAALRAPLTRHPRLSLQLAERLYAWVGASLREAIVGRFDVDPAALAVAMEDAVASAQARRSNLLRSQDDERRRMESQLVRKLNAAGQLKPGYLVRALREQRLSLFVAALAELSELDGAAIDAVIDHDHARLLALACMAAGVDHGAFPTIFHLVRQLSGGRPTGDVALVRAALDDAGIQDPASAAETFRQAAATLAI